MPIVACKRNGKTGRRWGGQKCYTGPGASARAASQAAAAHANGYEGHGEELSPEKVHELGAALIRELMADSPDVEKYCGGEGGKPGPCPEGGATAEPSKGWLSRVKEVPGKALAAARNKVQATYQKLESRYGPRYAKAILGAGLAGVPLPLPGASIATAAPVLAVAELHRRLSGQHSEPSRFGGGLWGGAEDMRLHAELSRYCQEGEPKPGPCPESGGKAPKAKKPSKAEQRKALYESMVKRAPAEGGAGPKADITAAPQAPSAPAATAAANFDPAPHLDALAAAVKEHGGQHNFAPLVKVRGSLGHLSCEQQDAVIHEARKRGLVSASALESGRTMSPAEYEQAKAAGIPIEGGTGVHGFLHLRQHAERFADDPVPARIQKAIAGLPVADPGYGYVMWDAGTGKAHVVLSDGDEQPTYDQWMAAVRKVDGVKEVGADAEGWPKGNWAKVRRKGEPQRASKFSEGADKLSGVEIFSSGPKRGKQYSPEDLRDIVRNFRQFSMGQRPGFRVPAVLGHPEEQEKLEESDLPAAAWANALRVKRAPQQGNPDRHVLEADLEKLPPAIRRLLKGRRYATVSAEIYDEPPEGIPGKGKMLRRIAFLGGDIPQDKTIADIPVPEEHSERGATYRATVLTFREATPRPARGTFEVFSEVRPMDRQAMIQALADHGCDTSVLTDAVPDEALAEMLRLCDAKDNDQEAGEYDEEEGQEDMSAYDESKLEEPRDEPHREKLAEKFRAMGKFAAAGLRKYCGDKMDDQAMPPDAMGAAKADEEGGAAMPQQPKKTTVTHQFSEADTRRVIREEIAAALKKEVQGSIDELTKFREDYAASEKLKGTESAVDLRIKAGRLPPSEREHTIALLMGMDAKRVEKFSEGGKVKQMTAYDRFLHMIDQRPTLFTERFKGAAADGKAGTPGGEDAEVQKVKDTFERFSESFPRGTKVETLVKGFEAERKHNKRLTAEDFLEGLRVGA